MSQVLATSLPANGATLNVESKGKQNGSQTPAQIARLGHRRKLDTAERLSVFTEMIMLTDPYGDGTDGSLGPPISRSLPEDPKLPWKPEGDE